MKVKFLVFIILLILAACGTGNDPAADEGHGNVSQDPVAHGNAVQDSVTQENGQTPLTQELIIGENVDLGGYDPNRDMSPFIRFLIFDSLVELGYNFEQIPGLATHWQMSEDGMTWTFTLREGVSFHDGEPWNAEAARINFQSRIDAGAGGFYQSISSMEAPDDYTFIVNLTAPIFTFASDVSVPSHGFVSPLAINDNNEVTAPIGTGPFMFESWTRDVEFTMTPNPNFHRGAPRLERLRFVVIPDANTRAMALESGEIHMMSGRGALTALESLRGRDNIQTISTLSQTSEFIMINTFNESLSDINVRRAIAHAVDFVSVVPALLTDLAVPPENFFSPVYGRFVDPNFQLPQHDPQRASEYLQAAGFSPGELSLEILVDSRNEENNALVVVMQEQLRNVGIELNINLMDAAAISARVTGPDRDFQLAMRGQYFIPTDDPSIHYRTGYFHSASNHNLFSTPEMDEMIDRLFHSLDEEERITLHLELQREITAQVPVIMMFHRNSIVLADQKLTNFRLASGTWQIFKGLEEAYLS